MCTSLYRWLLARLGLKLTLTDMLRRWQYGEPLAWLIGAFILGYTADLLVPVHCRVVGGVLFSFGLLGGHLFWANNTHRNP